MEINSFRKIRKKKAKEIVDTLSSIFDKRYREGKLKRMKRSLDLSH